MAFNGSGVHNRVHDWTQDLANTIPVTASRMDAEHDDISASLSNAVCRDGQSTTTARIPFASGVAAAAGTTSSVSYAQTNDNNTGLYFPGSDQWGLVAGGTATLTSTSTKVTVGVDVDFTGAIAPTSSDGAALGSSTQMWSDLFLASGAFINFNNGDVTVTHSANNLAFAGANNYTFDAKISPLIDDSAPLGDTAHQFSDLFLASGAVIAWNNADVSITHSSNTLAIAGGTVTFDNAPTPASSDGAALGTSSVMWSDLFLASGAVVNFNNGDVTITHSSNALTIAGGTVVAAIQLLHVRDEKPAGTHGGTFTSGAWQTRTLNTESANEISGASVSSSQITLPAGTYLIQGSAPAQLCNAHVAKLRNITDSSDVIIGTAELSQGASEINTRSFVNGRFTIAAQKTFEFQHRCEVTRSTAGFGRAANLGVTEVYAEVMIWKVA